MLYLKAFSNRAFLFAEFVLFGYLVACSFFYLNFFESALLAGQVSSETFTRIVVPDTLLYLDLAKSFENATSFVDLNIKNSSAPALIWYFMGEDWFAVMVFNLTLVAFTIFYFKKLCIYFLVDISKMQLGVVLLILNPSTLYYCIGSLKELPMMFLMLFGLHAFLNKRWLFFLMACLLLIFIRYQMAVIILIMLVISGIRNHALKMTLIIIGIAGAIYPAISNFEMFSPDAINYYRGVYGGDNSLGGFVENIRASIYGASLIAIIIRVFQTLFEPLLMVTVRGSFFEDGLFSVFDFSQYLNSVMFLFLVPIIIKKIISILRTQKNISSDKQIAFSFLVSSLGLICGFSFIHHRYAFPFFPIMLLAAMIPIYHPGLGKYDYS